MKKLVVILFFIGLCASMSCRQEPTGSISVSKSAVGVDEEVTVTISDAKDYTCVRWGVISDSPDFVDVIGGGTDELSWTLKFSSPGTATITATLKNCKKSDDKDDLCSCEKNHTSERFEIMVVVE